MKCLEHERSAPRQVLGYVRARGKGPLARRPDHNPSPASIFRPSDVAEMAKTGRPQMVEFFHHA